IAYRKYYAGNLLQTIVANQEMTYTIPGVQLGTEGDATVRIGIGRQLARNRRPKLFLNGTEVQYPDDVIRGYDQRNRVDFFGTLEIPVDYALLQEGTNEVKVSFPDGGGRVSSVILQLGTLGAEPEPIGVTGVTVFPKSLGLLVGDQGSLAVDVTPADAANKAVSWSSTDPAVATVDSLGVVTAQAVGSAMVIVTTEDGGLADTSVVTVVTCDVTYTDDDGLVVIEAENAASLPQGWEVKTDEAGYATDGYLTWTGDNFFNAPGNAIVEYQVQIVKTGTYRFEWRSQAGLSNTTEENDSWLKILGADDFYGQKANGGIVRPKGVCTDDCPEGSGGDGWFKVYVNNTEWVWGGKTSDNDPHTIYAKFDTPGLKTIQLSARSHDHLIDKIILFHGDIPPATARNVNNVETLCDPVEPSDLAVAGVAISPAALTLVEGDVQAISAIVTPANAADKSVSWSSDNPNVVEVDENGVLTALVEGQATVTVTTTDGGFTATSAVTVTPSSSRIVDTLSAIHDAYLQ
ncbi:MAG: Ig-like domain-containing protein, partial [Bacteroidota bacterium]